MKNYLYDPYKRILQFSLEYAQTHLVKSVNSKDSIYNDLCLELIYFLSIATRSFVLLPYPSVWLSWVLLTHVVCFLTMFRRLDSFLDLLVSAVDDTMSQLVRIWYVKSCEVAMSQITVIEYPSHVWEILFVTAFVWVNSILPNSYIFPFLDVCCAIL